MVNSLIGEEMRGWLPTGHFELIKNPRKMWFEFWKPATVMIEIYSKWNDEGTKDFRCFDPDMGYGFSISKESLDV